MPVTYQEWFCPFLAHVGTGRYLDIWGGFIDAGGPIAAFPYGPLYILVFGPLTWAGGLLSPRASAAGLGLTVLVLDMLLFAVIGRLVPVRHRATTTYGYWLSPIVIYVLYWHGQLDVLPVLLLAVSLLFLRRSRFGASGLLLGLATAAKLSMALSIPFVWLYVLVTRRLRAAAPPLLLGTTVGAVTLLPFMALPGFRAMVLDTPEKEKVFALGIAYGGSHLFVMPLAVAALFVLAWRIRRFNFAMVFDFVGIGFFTLFLLTPASPGWAMWLMPFLVVHQARAGRTGWLLALAFSVLFVIFHLLTSSGIATLPPVGGERMRALLLSAYVATGGAVAFQMFLWGIVRSPFRRATREPLVMAIAGDSGAGKDTLATALGDIFGAPSTAIVSGDDYHLWDRHKPMWSALTHLNPRANDLRRFTHDVLALAAGHTISAAHYDHRVGRMTKPRLTAPKDVVIAAGLHALYPADLRDACDLRIFLAMDEGLRRFFKIRRDVVSRGHALDTVTASLNKREADSSRYIRPQADHADLVMSLVPIDRRDIAEPLRGTGQVRMALAIEYGDMVDPVPLVRTLMGTLGLHIVQEERDMGHPKILVDEGMVTPGDMAAAARQLAPDMIELLALRPQWAGGLTGIMQLVVLDHIAQRLHFRQKAP